jgi:dTDP-4-amino-4,6-dideoxygalactose transaminase
LQQDFNKGKTMSVPFIDLKTQYLALKDSIQIRINKVLESGAYVSGPEVAELEKKLAEHTGVKHVLACASGTDALLIPLMGLGIGPGDEVITTAFSFIATAETIVLAGAKPVYCDIDPKTFNIDTTKIEQLITPKTKAIMPVSLYGQVADMNEKAVVITSSPGPIPKPIKGINRASVPLAQARTCFTPVCSANFFSSSATSGPLT